MENNKNRKRLILHTPFSNKKIISYGLIVIADDTKNIAIVQRKHSAEFLLYIRGIYRLTHLSHILSFITLKEYDMIDDCVKGDKDTFKHLYTNTLQLNIDNLEYAYSRFVETKDFVFTIITKQMLINNTLTWNWPKGRLSYDDDIKEIPFDCAKREFREEMDIVLPDPTYVSSKYIIDSYQCITNTELEYRYWIYRISNEIELIPPINNIEVENRMWVSMEDLHLYIKNSKIIHRIPSYINS